MWSYLILLFILYIYIFTPIFFVSVVSQHSPSERTAVLESIGRAIETIHQQAAYAGGRYTKEQRENLE